MDHLFVHDIDGLPASEQVGSLRASGLAAPDAPILRTAPDLLRSLVVPGDKVLVLHPEVLGPTSERILTICIDLLRHGVTVEAADPHLAATPDMIAALQLVAHPLIRIRDSRRAAGKKGGRPRALDSKLLERAVGELERPGATVSSVARKLGIPPATLYRHLPPRRPRS